MTYPLSELLTGLSYFIIAYKLNIFSVSQDVYKWITFVFLLIVISFFIVILLTDMKYMIIPNRIVYAAIAFVLLYLVTFAIFTIITTYYQLNSNTFGKYLLAAGYWQLQSVAVFKSLISTIVSAVLIGAFFWLLTLIKGGKAMGGGDVKLAFLIGLFNGFPENVIAIFLGFFTGAVISVALIGIRKKTMKDIIPFGPFLILGSFIALFWGNSLLDLYLGLFN